MSHGKFRTFNYKFTIVILSIIVITSVGFAIQSYYENESKNSEILNDVDVKPKPQLEYYDSEQKPSKFLIPAQRFQIDPTVEYDAEFRPESSLLFHAFGIEGIHFTKTSENIVEWFSIDLFPKPSLNELYNELGVKTESQNTVVIYPLFTASAYSPRGFYDYYTNQCDQSCLNVKIQESFTSPASGNGVQVLKLLGYEVITDIDFAKDPGIIKQYDKIILLHNEYVTKEMFDAITSHHKVLYLYPNALYAEIEANYDQNTITLIRGHAYPEKHIDNGFDWEFDNTQMEYDLKCENWKFYKIDNGMMLNCNPDNVIISNEELLKFIKNF